MKQETIRNQFPALGRKYNGQPLIYLDGPAGTQVPNSVIEAVSHYYRTCNANSHGQFITTHETDQMMEDVRNKVADFLGAPDGRSISYGQNMTTLNYSLSHAFGRVLQPGDEILITQLDHESNRGPWLGLRSKGIIVREVSLLPDGTLDYTDFAAKINERTRMVAMGYASNIFGTVNSVDFVRELTYAVGAWLLIDAVHYAPHLPIDAAAMGCDFLLCSAYKFYGPHVGLLYSKHGMLDSLPTDRLRTQEQFAPYSIETGTLNHAAIAGVGAAVDFIAGLGTGDSRRQQLKSGMEFIHLREKEKFQRLYDGLSKINGIEIFGPSPTAALRAPTLSFTLKGKTAEQVCQQLGEKGICAWDGHFYAVKAAEIMGFADSGGVTRMGISVYTTDEEIDRTLEVMNTIAV